VADEEEEGPSSAPRLREGLAAAADDEQDAEQDFQEDEAPIKTPPPESGRQHVAAQVAPPPEADASDELEMDISITVAETTPSPIEAAASEPPPPDSVRAPTVAADLGLEPMPRLAFVSEPEIELHIGPKARPPSERPPAVVTKSEPAPASAVVPLPAAEAKAPAASPPARAEATRTSPVSIEEPARPAPPSAPPPVRLMAQPDAVTAAPVEVWASTHAPRDLKGQVANFVGQNVSFAPKSFGDLLDASLSLGDS
jgi:hypothetical protein